MSRWARIAAGALLAWAMWLSPVLAQTQTTPSGPRKPVIEYIVVVVLVAVAVGLVCRSSRRF